MLSWFVGRSKYQLISSSFSCRRWPAWSPQPWWSRAWWSRWWRSWMRTRHKTTSRPALDRKSSFHLNWILKLYSSPFPWRSVWASERWQRATTRRNITVTFPTDSLIPENILCVVFFLLPFVSPSRFTWTGFFPSLFAKSSTKSDKRKQVVKANSAKNVCQSHLTVIVH